MLKRFKKENVICVAAMILTGIIIAGFSIKDYLDSKPLSEAKIKETLPIEIAEDMTDITILDRQTTKKINDVISIEIVSQNDVAKTTKYYVVEYKYIGDKWTFYDYDSEDLDKWDVTPIVGITDKTLDEEIKKQEEDGAKVSLKSRDTDLENKKETLTFNYEYQDDILTSKGTFDVIYEFNGTAWIYYCKTNEEYDNVWDFTGTWTLTDDSSSRVLEVVKTEDNITGSYKASFTGFWSSASDNIVFTSGSFDNEEGILKMEGLSYHEYADPTETVLIGEINSKEKTISLLMTNFFGNIVLKKQ